MKHIESLAVKYHQEKVGTLSLSADGKVCTFESVSYTHLSNYKRELSLDNATAALSYTRGGIQYQREYFARCV